MKRFQVLSLLVVLALLLGACSTPATPAPTQPTAAPAAPTEAPAAAPTTAPAAPAKEIKLGYVLHGLNNFTQVIKQGAEDAGKALGVDVEVTGPAGFVSNEAIAMFEGLVQKGKDGLVVVPQPGDVWVAPIKEATDKGIPVLTANVTSPGSTAALWVGQDEYQSGVLLAGELKKQLEAAGKTDGLIVVGACVPSVQVLIDRYNGFVKGMAGSKFTVSQAYDVTPENTSNYSAWENLASANKDMVAAVGLCSLDVPNLAQLKTRNKAEWLIGGYDLNVETLDAIKAGVAQVTVGQQPYLQGFLPILALTQNLRDGKALPKGWLDVGTEVVTKDNVETMYMRESDVAQMTKIYADYIAKNWSGDLAAKAQPMPDHSKDAAPAPSTGKNPADVKVGYVLHGLNNFTQVIKQGAEDAGKALGINVEVTGPAGFVSNEAIAMFEGLVQKGKDGLVVVPQPGDVWVAPIKEATDAGIPVLTANVTSPDSAAVVWVGQDEYNSGVLLAQELQKQLAAAGKTDGLIVVGACVPSVQVLIDRYNGFVKGMAGSKFTVSQAYDVTPENTSNYSAWENLASANKDMVAAVGLCSLDVPNLAQLKTRNKAAWLIGGYDLNVETLDAIKAGIAQVTVGQQPYLQGYLPILALYQKLVEGKELPKGWLDVGTEVVTKDNVDEKYTRESDVAAMTKIYADYIAKNFGGDLSKLAQPMPDHSKDAAPAAAGPKMAASEVKFGYVLHGLNNFTQVIKQGAEDAGKAFGVDVEVTGPAGFVSNEAIAMFEGLVQKGKTGLVVVPQPGDVWVAPIKEATDAGIPVLTANVTSPDSAAVVWVGQDEYNSGVLLAQELQKQLTAAGKTDGLIVVGACVPSVQVLIDRYNGFVKGMAGSKFTVSQAYDVTPENTSNYSAWENLASANKDMIAAVGLCSLDVPNLAQLKTRNKAAWLIGGYDLNVETLDAIKAGVAQVTVGQQPYLQGYLPIMALYQHFVEGKALPQGWIDVGTEVVTKDNVDLLYERESDPAAMTKIYAEAIQKNFAGDLAGMAKPLPSR